MGNKNSNIVNTKSSKGSSNSNPFEFLECTNDWLESVPERAINALNNSVGNGEKIAQAKVDAICLWVSWKINIQIERVRQATLRALYGMYKNTAAGKVIQVINVIKEFVSDPIKTIGSFASAIFAPFAPIVKWLPTLQRELPRLAKNLANIASSLPPTPPSPHINYDKFKIKVKTISISTITSDPNKLPSPEAMFPEPPKPISSEIFESIFNNSSAKLKSNKVMYKLTERQKESLKIMSDSSFELKDGTEVV